MHVPVIIASLKVSTMLHIRLLQKLTTTLQVHKIVGCEEYFLNEALEKDVIGKRSGTLNFTRKKTIFASSLV